MDSVKNIIRKCVVLLIITSKIFALYIMSNGSLERYYFVLYDGALTLKLSKIALNAFCYKTLHISTSYTKYFHPTGLCLFNLLYDWVVGY